MSLVDVLNRYGTAALLRFTASLVLFLVLHLVRIPLVLTTRVLEGVALRVDAYATRQATRRPNGPINHYFAHDREKEEGAHVYA